MSASADPATRLLRLSLAVTGRPWADRLHRFVQDHGGGRVVARLLCAEDALEADADVVLVDDISSFLSARLVAELQERGRIVVGVFDPEEPEGAAALRRLSVDLVVSAAGPPGPLLERIRDARPVPSAGSVPRPVDDRRHRRRPRRIGVLGARGANGVTETAFLLASLGVQDGLGSILVDLDLDLPSVAQRAGAVGPPDLGDAIEAVVHGRGSVTVAVQDADGLSIVVGLPPGEPPRAFDVDRVLGELPTAGVVIDLGCLPWSLDDPRRRLVGDLDAICLVVAPTPVGVARAVDVAAALDLPPERTAVVVARTPRRRRTRVELAATIAETFPAAAYVFVPYDRRLARSAWNGVRPTRGAAPRSLRPLARVLLEPRGTDP